MWVLISNLLFFEILIISLIIKYFWCYWLVEMRTGGGFLRCCMCCRNVALYRIKYYFCAVSLKIGFTETHKFLLL